MSSVMLLLMPGKEMEAQWSGWIDPGLRPAMETEQIQVYGNDGNDTFHKEVAKGTFTTSATQNLAGFTGRF